MANDNDNLLNDKNIENFNNDQGQKEIFFTKKRILLGLLFSSFSIIFIVLLSVFAFGINFDSIITLIKLGAKNSGLPLTIFFFFLIFLFPIFNVLSRIFTIKKRLYSISSIRIKWYEWVSFNFISIFIATITPFAIGSEPYSVFWFKSKGVSINDISVIIASNGLLNSFTQILITWPSFFVIASQYSAYSVDPFWLLAFWLGFTGLIFDLMGFLVWWFLGYSRRVHFAINFVLNFIKRKLKMSYHTKDEIYEKFRTNAIFKKQFIALLKDYKITTFIILIGLFWNIFFYSTLLVCFRLIQDKSINIDYFNLFNYVNVATTANNWVPVPNGEGTLQMLITWFISPDIANTNPNLPSNIQWQNYSNNGIFIWRFCTSYLPVMIFALFIPFEIKMLHNRKKAIKSLFHRADGNGKIEEYNEYEKIDKLEKDTDLISDDDQFSNIDKTSEHTDKLI